jgi:hypothetical protein
VKLIDIFNNLSDLDGEGTIYATEPWNEDSEAFVAKEPENGGGLPAEAPYGVRYFLEAAIVLELVQDWTASRIEPPTSSATCKRVIEYAINDA